jgi:hypothetical protein
LTARWLCIGENGEVSVAADGERVWVLDVPPRPTSYRMSTEGNAFALWYPELGQMIAVTGAVPRLRFHAVAPQISVLLALSDDGALVLAKSEDGCVWLFGASTHPTCVLWADDIVTAGFSQNVFALARSNGEVYVFRPAAYAAELLVTSEQGIRRPVAVQVTSRNVYVADADTGAIHEISRETLQIRSFESPAPPSQLVPAGRGLYLATELASGSLVLLETSGEPRLVLAALESRDDP